jgi:hypothetical protein
LIVDSFIYVHGFKFSPLCVAILNSKEVQKERNHLRHNDDKNVWGDYNIITHL